LWGLGLLYLIGQKLMGNLGDGIEMNEKWNHAHGEQCIIEK
jgi:hypothetical protein